MQRGINRAITCNHKLGINLNMQPTLNHKLARNKTMFQQKFIKMSN